MGQYVRRIARPARAMRLVKPWTAFQLIAFEVHWSSIL